MEAVVAAGLLEPFTRGRGFQDWILGTSPAAGANFTYTLEGQWQTRVLSIVFRLVTDGNAANRAVTVEYADEANLPFARMGYGAVVTASTTQDHAFMIDRSVAEWATGTLVFAPLSDVVLGAARRVRIVVANIQVGDQLSAIRMVVERFYTGGPGYAPAVEHGGG